MEVGATAVLDRTAKIAQENGHLNKWDSKPCKTWGESNPEEGAARILRQACAEVQKQQGMWLAWCEQ